MLEVKNVYAGYSEKAVLQGLSMEAKPGTVTTVLGRNGCGKSTLLKTLVGLLPLRGGEIVIDGCAISDLGTNALAKKIAYLPQSKNVPEITAGRLVLHGRFPYLSYPRRYSQNDRKIAEEAMERMGLLPLWDVPLGELSGGTRQRVYIAMALAKQAPIILMDEPTAYLDIGQQRLFSDMLAELTACGKTVVLVLHDLLLALKHSDVLCVMENGVICCSGTAEEILQDGVLNRLYGIEIGTVKTSGGLQYYYK